MIRKPLIIQLLLSALFSYLAWGGNEKWLMLSIGLISLWSFSRNKVQAYLCVLSYYLAASYGLIKGVGVFFGNPGSEEISIIPGIVIWLLPNIILSLPWAVLWGREGYYWRILTILFLVAIPPLGLFGWANPVTAAGVLFPGASWLGLFATVILLILLCYTYKPSMSLVISIGLLATFSAICQICYKNPQNPLDIIGIDTELGWIKSLEDEYEHNKLLIEKVNEVIENNKGIKLILLPELVIGSWNNANKHLWQKLNQKSKELGITILLGGKVNFSPREYISGMIAIGKEEDIILLDRVPVPISMWRPWAMDKTSAISHWFNPGVYNIQDKIVASIICYEQLLIWPFLHSMIYSPEIMLASSNTWWARDTNIPSIQQQVIKAWARLFNKSLIKAANW